MALLFPFDLAEGSSEEEEVGRNFASSSVETRHEKERIRPSRHLAKSMTKITLPAEGKSPKAFLFPRLEAGIEGT